MYCPVCGKEEPMMWNSDEDMESLGSGEPGIVSMWECRDCGIFVEIYMPEVKHEEGN